MKTTNASFSIVLGLLLIIGLTSCGDKLDEAIVTLPIKGDQPSVDRDPSGKIGIAYGSGKEIYFAFSEDHGSTFSTEMVGSQNDLVLGMSSGPRLAMGKEQYTIVAPTRSGDLSAWTKKAGANKWEGPYTVNDLPGSAGESLLDITFDKDQALYAVWIDTRSAVSRKPEIKREVANENHSVEPDSKAEEPKEAERHKRPKQRTKEELMEEIGEMPKGSDGIRQYPGSDGKLYWVVMDKEGNALKAENMESYLAFKEQNESRPTPKGKIYLSKSVDGGASWSKSQLVYSSPDGSVCECCMPTIESDDAGNIYVMFRNNLAGSRDMYLTQSSDKGLTFDNPKKLGLETWPLKGCPMDGGGLMAANSGDIATTWQREGKVYFSTPDEAEVMIGVGRAPAINAGSNGIYIAWTSGEKVMIKVPDNETPIDLGTGSSPKVLPVEKGEAVLIVWVDQGEIKMKKMS